MKIFNKILITVSALVLALSSMAISACSPKQPNEYAGYDVVDVNKLDGRNLVTAGDKPAVKWEGRYEYKDEMIYLYNAATGYTVDFVGTELSVEFWHDKGNIYYDVALDDEVLPNVNTSRRFYLPSGQQDYTWKISGLEKGHHKITCLKMDEAKNATTAIKSISTDGKFIYRNVENDADKLKVMAICASGGSGFGALGYSEVSNNAVNRTNANSSALHSFNYLTARMLDADIQYVASSGWGVNIADHSVIDALDYTGVTTSDNVTGAKTTAKWDAQNWVPDIVLINIGGNDGVASATSDYKKAYQKRVVELLQRLHGDYPYASIVWVHTTSSYWTLTNSAITSNGIDYVLDCAIPNVGEGTTGAGTYGASNHCSLKSQIDGTDIVVSLLESKVGYRRVRENINFNDFVSILDCDKKYEFKNETPVVTGVSDIKEELLQSEYVHWVGRNEYVASEKRMYTYYAATGFSVTFQGTELSVTYNSDNTSSSKNRPYFSVGVDGAPVQNGTSFSLTSPTQTVKVVSGLTNGTHTVTVLKRSEPENAKTSISAIKTNGTFSKYVDNTTLRFQIIGSSGITGHGCFGTSSDWTTENSSALKGFGYLSAYAFGAETQFVSASAMGMCWTYRGVTTMSKAYEAAGLVASYNASGSTTSVLPTSTAWDHSKWTPDVVIANIGGNDWNAKISGLSGTARTEAETQFKDAVKTLLTRIHTLYPNAKVVWTVNSTTSGNGALANTAINTLSFKSQIVLVSIDNTKDGSDNHASEATQLKNAKTVVEAIKKLGYTQVNNI